MPVTMYGFKGCDTVKKARAWLDARAVPYEFFDYPKAVDRWFERAGWEAVFNKNSTTFKELPESRKAAIDAKTARAMILAETNLIKRPVLDVDGALTFGFKPDAYEAALRK
jgi:arsenate reductase (glutaredoxin)